MFEMIIKVGPQYAMFVGGRGGGFKGGFTPGSKTKELPSSSDPIG